MIIRLLLAFFVLVLPRATCKTGDGQDQPASPPARTGEFPEIILAGPFFQPLAAAGKDQLLVGGKNPRAFALYDLITGKKISQFSTPELHGPIALSPDGKTVAGIPSALQKDRLVLIDTATGRIKTTLAIEKVADRIFFLSNERIATASIWEKTALIWDLPTSKKIEQINFSNAGLPGRLPLVFSSDGKKALFLRENQIFLLQIDAKEEIQIGTIEQKIAYGRAVVGIAFSPDGTEAVFLLETLGKQSLEAWNLAEKTHSPAVEFPVTGHTSNQGERLLACPDGRGYLVNGNTLVERKSLKKLWSLADIKLGALPLVFPTAANRVLRLEMVRQNLRVVEHARPKEFLNQAIALVREGKDARDALLRTGSQYGRKNARTFEIPLGGVAWNVSSPARTSTHGLAARPFPIGYTSLQIGQVLFSSASAGIVGVEFLDQPGIGQTGATGFDFYNLATGRKTSQVAFPQPSRVVALWASGGQILATEVESADRLDLYDSRGKILGSWKPLEETTGGNEQKLALAAFTGDDRVLANHPWLLKTDSTAFPGHPFHAHEPDRRQKTLSIHLNPLGWTGAFVEALVMPGKKQNFDFFACFLHNNHLS